MTQNQEDSPAIGKRLWPALVQLWILASIAAFFVIRVLGSQTAQRLLAELQHRHRS